MDHKAGLGCELTHKCGSRPTGRRMKYQGRSKTHVAGNLGKKLGSGERPKLHPRLLPCQRKLCCRSAFAAFAALFRGTALAPLLGALPPCPAGRVVFENDEVDLALVAIDPRHLNPDPVTQAEAAAA